MMTEGGFYQQRRLSPTGVTVVVLLHGAALAALLTAKMVVETPPPFIITKLHPIAPPPEPPPPPPPTHQPLEKKPTVESHVDLTRPTIELPPIPGPVFDPGPSVPDLPRVPIGEVTIPPPPPPPPPVAHEPVRTAAQMDGRSALQPPYPASAQREGAEGFVQVRVAIGADGRVKSVEKVRASRDDFFAATERQALRFWRFKPATVDGKPIESSKILSVTFRLDESNG